ncbi:MAG: hypothetical protein M3O71_09280 [Bacteroidota bacterium]|nr:hypothetical protein [Bacteroidota bacterium]
MNQFAERYKKLSNAALLQIVDTPADYQPEAIAAAKDELAHRQLSEEELSIACEENELQLKEEQKRAGRINVFKDTVKNAAWTVGDTLNPVLDTKPTTTRIILWISILMGMLFIYTVYMQYGLLVYMFKYNRGAWSFSIVIYFLRSLIVPVAAVLFAMRKKWGWIILSLYFTFLGLNTIGLFSFALKNTQHQTTALDSLAPATQVSSLLGWAIFNAGCLYFIYKKEVRELYRINMQSIMIAIVLGMLLTLTTLF